MLKKSTKFSTYGFLAAVGSAFILMACDRDNKPEEPGVTSYSVSGWISRSASINLADGQDGIGTIYIAAFTECSLEAELTGSGFVMDADLSVTGVIESFKVPQLRPGTHHLAVFLDENGDALQTGPRPGPKDLVYAPSGAGDGNLDCYEVNIDSTDVFDIGIELNGVAPG